MGWDTDNVKMQHGRGALHEQRKDVGEWLDSVNAPESPSNSQQLSNLIEYVVDAVCFGDGNTSFDTSFRSLSGSQRSAQQIHEREQSVRIDRCFGPVFKPKPAAPKEQLQHQPVTLSGFGANTVQQTLPGAAGLGKPIKQESRLMCQQAPQVGVPNGVVNTLQQAIDKLNRRNTPSEKSPEAIKALSDAALLEEKRNLKQGLRSFDVLFEKVTGRAPEKNDKEPLRTVYAYYKELKKEIGVRGASHPTSALAAAMNEKDDVAPVRQGAGAAAGGPSTYQYAANGAHSRPTADPYQHHQQLQHQTQLPFGTSYDYQQQPSSYPAFTSASNGPPASSAADAALPTSATQLTPEELESLRIEKKAIKRKLFEFMSKFKEKHGREVKSKEDRAPCAAEYERYRHLKAILATVD